MGMHTRGPWKVLPEEVDKPYIRIRGTVLGGRYRVANVLTPIYDGVHEREAVETRANARLIAAAPELLDSLIVAREWLRGDKWRDSTVEKHSSWEALMRGIDKAIAKATGGAK
jgi:hypothetical protein